MHIVTFNNRLYKTFSEAAEKANGLAVVGLFFEERSDIPETETQLFKMSAFLRSTQAVQAANSSAVLDPFPVGALFDVGADRGRFYRYDGSLTTPPCTENVVWTLMKKILPVTPKQVRHLLINFSLMICLFVRGHPLNEYLKSFNWPRSTPRPYINQ